MLRFETISAQEIEKYINDKRALIIDVRDYEKFNQGHIENAICIPFEKLEREYNRMPRDLILVLYCETGGTGMLAAKELFDRGYVVKVLVGGIKGYHGKHIVRE